MSCGGSNMDNAATTAATVPKDYLRGPRPLCMGVDVDELFLAQLWDFQHQQALQEALMNRDFSYLSEAAINRSLADYEAQRKFPDNTNWDPAAFAAASAAFALANADADAVAITGHENDPQPNAESQFDQAMEDLAMASMSSEQMSPSHGQGYDPAPSSNAVPVPAPAITTTASDATNAASVVTTPPPVAAIIPPVDAPATPPSVYVIRLQFTFEGRKLKGKKAPKWIAYMTFTTVKLAELVKFGLYFNTANCCYEDRFLDADWDYELGQDEKVSEPMYKRLISFGENLSDDFLTAQVEIIGRKVGSVKAFKLRDLSLSTMVTAEVEKLGKNSMDRALVYFWDRDHKKDNVEMPHRFGGEDSIYGIAQGWWPWPRTRQEVEAGSPGSSSSASF